MKTLSERNAALLIRGVKTCGSMTEGYHYIVEDLYVTEATELWEFCQWVDKEVGGCSGYNIERLFECFKNPNYAANVLFVAGLKLKIAEIRNLTKTKL